MHLDRNTVVAIAIAAGAVALALWWTSREGFTPLPRLPPPKPLATVPRPATTTTTMPLAAPLASGPSLLDLAEFKGLSPDLKAQYRVYFQNTIAPRFVKLMNVAWASMTSKQKADLATAARATSKRLASQMDGLEKLITSGKLNFGDMMVASARGT